MAQRHSFVLSFVLIAFFILGYAGVALCEGRGITVEIRASNDPNAPVSESIKLYDNSYALVIGIDDYTAGWPKLRNAIADAQEIATELEKRGFLVTFKENLDSAGLQKSLKEFFALMGADPKARLFLWYAGHGHTLKDEGFLVPTDAPPPTAPNFKLKAIHMRDFGGFMRLAESKHVFAVFDSCFSGTIFQTRAGMVPAAITRATTKPVRQFLTSGDTDQEVSDDGTFRKLFLRALRGETRADANGDGYLLGTELGLYLSGEVTNITEQAQTPRYGKLRDADYNLGDFVFLLPDRGEAETASTDGPKEGATKTTAQGGQGEMVQIALWASIAAGDDPAEFEKYLERYPKGHFSAIAKRKIETLRAPKPTTTEKAQPAPSATGFPIPEARERVSVPLKEKGEPLESITWDFETSDLRGWTSTGNAFAFQPTYRDNPTARGRGQPSKHQGKYWIGSYEKYQGLPGQKPGGVQGDGPKGVLTSFPFTIPSGTLSFLVGGGSGFKTRVELLVSGQKVLHASGRNTETMHRVTWNLNPYTGKTGQIRIVDESSGGWGHINVDDFKFSAAPKAQVYISKKSAPHAEYKSYSHPGPYRFSVQHPADWEIDTSSPNLLVAFLGPQGGRFRTNFGVKFVSIPGAPAEIDRETALRMKTGLASAYHCTPEMRGKTIAGKKGYEFNYLTNIGGEDVRVFLSVIFIKGTVC